ncbi:DUF6387 family protein [Photobacterium leiognathi]|uniref:DUF6387 family protein n=1 Tax=Photobacterium leiognathi TaxID=553611 RepID=UPI002981EB73|nr:DUF6387 family protein [Photobacterium leiognathi]
MTSVSSTTHPHYPKWFNITNYNVLSDLTVEEFINQLDYRLTLQERITFYCRGKFKEYGWEKILKGNIVVDKSVNNNIERQTASITILNQLDLDLLAQCKEHFNTSIKKQREKQQNLLSSFTSSTQMTDDIYWAKEQYQLPFGEKTQSIALSIDLATASDEDILNDFRYLLNSMRKALDIQEIKNINTSKNGYQTLKKLLAYNVIPILDLYFYFATYTENQIRPLRASSSLISEVIFCGLLDEQQVKRTIRPFIQNTVLTSEIIENLFTKTKQDKELLSRKMSLL